MSVSSLYSPRLKAFLVSFAQPTPANERSWNLEGEILPEFMLGSFLFLFTKTFCFCFLYDMIQNLNYLLGILFICSC